jgi:hypothetical protein
MDAGLDAVLDAPPDVAHEVGADAPADAAPVPCVVVAAGNPVEVLAVSSQDVLTPSLVFLEPGSAATGQPGLVAVQGVVTHGTPLSSIQATRVQVGAAWPGPTTLSPTIVVGEDTFSYAQMARSSADSDRLALTWLGGPGTLAIRFAEIDVPTWAAAAPMALPIETDTPLSLCAGAGVDLASASYTGFGYALVTQESFGGNPPAEARPIVSVISDKGAVQVDSVPVSEPVPPMAPSPTSLWTGETYLLATAFDVCAPADPLCAPAAVVVARLDLSGGTAHLVAESVLPALNVGTVPSRPALVKLGDWVYAAWSERDPSNPDLPRTVRVAQLDVLGAATVGMQSVLSESAMPIATLHMVATSFGLMVYWPEEGDLDLSDGALGRSRMIGYRIEPSLDPPAPALVVKEGPVAIDATRFAAYGAPASVSLADPPSAVVVWAGWSGEYGQETISMGRWDCVP